MNIDIGNAAIDRASSASASYTLLDLGNPCNADGILTSISLFINGSLSGVKVGTFHGSGNSWTMRSYVSISPAGTGLVTINNLNISANAGDVLGIYYSGGTLDRDDSGGSSAYYSGDAFSGGALTFIAGVRIYSLYGTGTSLVPDPPTNVAASKNDSTKVTVTWQAGSGETGGHRVYFNGVDISGIVAHGTLTFDDTTAAAPVITAGASVASDGTSSSSVALSLSGNSIANGTPGTYTVKAINSYGLSDASTGDTGYRVAGAVTYQWQRSAGDSDASYSDINGATTANYNDTVPAALIGRYYKCKQDASGSVEAISTADRGYKSRPITLFAFLG